MHSPGTSTVSPISLTTRRGGPVTASPKLSCPQNKSLTIIGTSNAATVTWQLPTPQGQVEITTSYPIGTHTSYIRLPGVSEVCVLTVSIKGEMIYQIILGVTRIRVMVILAYAPMTLSGYRPNGP